MWAPHPYNISCSLPSLPEGRSYPTADWLPASGSALVCYQHSCTRLTPSGWEEGASTLEYRSFHTTSVTSSGLLLVGGTQSPNTTELLPTEGGDAVQSFPLEHEMSYHCSISLSPSSFILTGGLSTKNLVTEYSGVDTGEVTTRELPPLIHGWYSHACGTYTSGDTQVLNSSLCSSILLPRCCW